MTQDLALALLEGIEAGEKVGARIEALVAAVLEAPAVRLAQSVQAGGPHRVRRAIELAEYVLTTAKGTGKVSNTG